VCRSNLFRGEGVAGLSCPYGEAATGNSIQSSAKWLNQFLADNPDYALTPERVEQERLGDPIGAGSEHMVRFWA
jgi:hypothetical protein